MNESTPLPKIGDRVSIAGRHESFIVIAIDESNASVSLRPVGESAFVPADKVISLRPPKDHK
jgi:hypothetical protein